MNKTVKRIIAMTLAIGAFSTIEPTQYLNLMTKEAYAYSSSDDVAFLEDIDLDHGHIRFSKTKTSYSESVSSSVDEIEITADPKDSDYEVTIDGETNTGEWTKTIDLDRGRNSIKIRVEDPSGDKDPVTYRLYINRGHSSSYDDDDDDDYDDDDIYLDDITVDEGNLDFSRKTSRYTVNVGSDVSEIRIKAKPEYSGDEVRIDGRTVDEDDNYRRTVSLHQGTNTVEITIEDDDNDNERTYTLYINRGTSTMHNSGKIDTKQDSIYLDRLLIEAGSIPIGFTRRVTSYSANVKKECDEIIITAEPDDGGDVVRVNGDRVDRNYKKLVKLDEGKNEIKVKVSNEDDDFDDDDDYEDNFEERTYTITVYRGTSQGTTNTDGTNTDSSNKFNQWVSVDGKWQRKDALGNTVKNTWYYDRTYAKTYYLKENGDMATGWLNNNGLWYYLDGSGALQTGWKLINGNWYYLDMAGAMQTGWFRDKNGSWYYLNSSGAMVTNTTIGGCKLGSNGAWIK